MTTSFTHAAGNQASGLTTFSLPEIYSEVSSVGRPGVRLPYVSRFGLHYRMLEDRIIITLMPGVNWQVTNERVMAELAKSLKLVCAIISAEPRGKGWLLRPISSGMPATGFSTALRAASGMSSRRLSRITLPCRYWRLSAGGSSPNKRVVLIGALLCDRVAKVIINR
jgi:hypothetical protein